MKTRHGMLVPLAVLALVACHQGDPGSPPAPVRSSQPSAAPGPNAVAPMSPADAPVTRGPVGPNLYTRLGGVDAIRAVVTDFVGRVAADDRINAFFRGVDLTNLKPQKAWHDYVAGVAAKLESSHWVQGCNLTIASTVPLGGGLSSSASLEVATALALTAFMGLDLAPKHLALLCQKAE